jgi:trans-aconitate methyltransferase
VASKTTWDTELYEAKHNFVWKLGSDLIELLAPKPGESILDLGCGTGHLTAKIGAAGADVTGLDASPDMIGQARQNFPQLKFLLQNAASMHYEAEFDAVFSNAALHWMPNAAEVAAAMARALRPGGRLVAEFGGKGNIGRILEAIEKVLPRHYHPGIMPASRTYFPSAAEYGTLLEAHGLELRFAQLFNRPTPLDGSHGMEDWIRQFKWYYFQPLAPAARKLALSEVVEELRPQLCRDGQWTADYRRLRVIAVRT